MTNKEKFIENANKKYNNKYDYSKFMYKNAKTRSIIICPIHNGFEQSPDKHLNSKYGCPECSLTGRSITSQGLSRPKVLKYTWKEIEKKLMIKFSTFTFTCENYTGTKSRIVLTCPHHGDHITTPHSLLHKNVTKGCPMCGIQSSVQTKTSTFTDFVKQASSLYNYKYTYVCNDYVNKRSKIICKCEYHGEFTKSAQKHLAGQGCPKCTVEVLRLSGKLPGGYCETIFSRSEELKSKAGTLYYLKVGKLYKIGITINLTQRINALRSKFNTDINIIDTVETTLYNAFKLEQQILETFKEFRIFTEASTELFVKDVLNGKILK